MSRNNCCVPMCCTTSNDGVILHFFPNPAKDIERFRLWVLKIGGEIIGLEDQIIFKTRRVCHKHFPENVVYLSNRLSKTAVPQLELPAPHRLHVTMNQVDLRRLSMEQRQATSSLNIDAVPSTSQAPLSHPLNVCQPKEETSTAVLNIDEVTSQRPNRPQRKHDKKVSCKIFQSELATTKKIVKKLKVKQASKTSTNSVESARNISKTRAFQILTNKMSDNAKRFFCMQITQSGKKLKGRRFTLDEKILALSLYKPSPKSYRILRKMCVLPSRRCLQTLLHTVKLLPGYNNRIFEHLKKRVSKMPIKYRYCTLVFDEMAISPSCMYNSSKDMIEGFVDNGQERENNFCDHVLVFMIRGVIKKYKQPVWFSYSAGATKTLSLKSQLKTIIKKLSEANLFVIATVCDQGSTNLAAINSLINDTRANHLRKNEDFTGGFFMVENKKIFPIYDPPHLMKGIRNNLINKNLKFKINGEDKVAKWEHIRLLYERSPSYRGVKMIPKLTAHHVVPELIPKMKVKHCTQVFSKSVGAALGCLAESGCLPKESTETADLLFFFDDLFDSVNGNYSGLVGGKIFRTAVTPKSPHHKLWDKSLPVLKDMKFDTPLRGGVVPSLTSWVKTIESFKKICMLLHKKGINSLLLRNFNQDALENFFGSIRAHGYANVMPNVSHFEAAYKTLLLNNLTSSHAIGSNCEADDGFALESFKDFLKEEEAFEPVDDKQPINIDFDHVLIEEIDTDFIIKDQERHNVEKCAAIGYCSGWIAVKAKKRIYKKCLICKNNVEAQTMQSFHNYIKIKEFENKRWLCYPTRCLFDFFAQVENITYEILKINATRSNLKEYVKLIVGININTNFLDCPNHGEEMICFLINKSVCFFINNWCKEVNHLLIGKAHIFDATDIFKNSARSIFLKSRRKKRYRQSGVSINV